MKTNIKNAKPAADHRLAATATNVDKPSRIHAGFTLIEVLVVVVIMGAVDWLDWS